MIKLDIFLDYVKLKEYLIDSEGKIAKRGVYGSHIKVI